MRILTLVLLAFLSGVLSESVGATPQDSFQYYRINLLSADTAKWACLTEVRLRIGETWQSNSGFGGATGSDRGTIGDYAATVAASSTYSTEPEIQIGQAFDEYGPGTVWCSLYGAFSDLVPFDAITPQWIMISFDKKVDVTGVELACRSCRTPEQCYPCRYSLDNVTVTASADGSSWLPIEGAMSKEVISHPPLAIEW